MNILEKTKLFFYIPQTRLNINRTHHAHHQFPKKPDQFRLHNDTDAIEKKSHVVNRISKIFPTTASTSSTEKSTERESQRPDDNFLMQSNGIENG